MTVVSAIATLMAKPLADQLFESFIDVRSEADSSLSPIFSAEPGMRVAFLYVLCSLCLMLVGSISFFVANLRTITV